AIVFCMSRKRCVEGAKAVAELNLLTDKRGDKEPEPPRNADAPALARWRAEQAKKEMSARANKVARDTMHRTHLQRYMPELGTLEAYTEFVELCFQQKLVKLVFATETLAVGVNMPARSVVFTQLDKPNDGNTAGHRPLRPDEFWQMAGRAGRRGMDDLGYVIYAPTLSVAGEQQQIASSQLVIDPPFVLRHLNRSIGKEVLAKTLLANQLDRQSKALLHKLTNSAGGADAAALTHAAKQLDEIESRLAPSSADQLKVKLSQPQIKVFFLLQYTMRLVRLASGQRAQSQATIETNRNVLGGQWDGVINKLVELGCVDQHDASKLTARGRTCAAFAEGHPLIIGTMIADGYLNDLSAGEICAWLCLFLKESRLEDPMDCPLKPEPMSRALEDVFHATYNLADYLGVDLDANLSRIMLDWCTHKSIQNVAAWVDPHVLGSFVKAVMRVVSYIDVVREVLLGLGHYELHARLDHHMEMLLGGLVTNESLYLRMGDF
ncbi:hypothetical protein T492DRAFT_1001400, partial [Pavlovales sp. CCMP2436]